MVLLMQPSISYLGEHMIEESRARFSRLKGFASIVGHGEWKHVLEEYLSQGHDVFADLLIQDASPRQRPPETTNVYLGAILSFLARATVHTAVAGGLSK